MWIRRFHSSTSRGSVQAALAGLVDGSLTAFRPVTGRRKRSYSSAALFPLQKTALMGAVLSMRCMSLGAAFFMEASDEPVISQLAITSQSATWLLSRNAFLSSIDAPAPSFSSNRANASSPVTAAMTFQKRFCGWP